MNYHLKYLKYKNKYFNLLNKYDDSQQFDVFYCLTVSYKNDIFKCTYIFNFKLSKKDHDEIYNSIYSCINNRIQSPQRLHLPSILFTVQNIQKIRYNNIGEINLNNPDKNVEPQEHNTSIISDEQLNSRPLPLEGDIEISKNNLNDLNFFITIDGIILDNLDIDIKKKTIIDKINELIDFAFSK